MRPGDASEQDLLANAEQSPALGLAGHTNLVSECMAGYRLVELENEEALSHAMDDAVTVLLDWAAGPSSSCLTLARYAI